MPRRGLPRVRHAEVHVHEALVEARQPAARDQGDGQPPVVVADAGATGTIAAAPGQVLDAEAPAGAGAASRLDQQAEPHDADAAPAGQEGEHGPAQAQRQVAVRRAGAAAGGAVMRAGREDRAPQVRELVADVEEADAGAGEAGPAGRRGAGAQLAPALARRVAEAHYEVAQRVHVELVVVRGQLDSPAANGSGEFEWEIPFVSEVEFEQTGIVLAGGRGYGFRRGISPDDVGIMFAHVLAAQLR